MASTREAWSLTLPEATTILSTRIGADAVSGPAWLHERRSTALEHLGRLGFPTTRHEDWRLTNLEPVLKKTYHVAHNGENLTKERVGRLAIPGLDASFLVFVNGQYRPDLSDQAELPEGVQVLTLPEALQGDAASIVEEHLAAHAEVTDDAFVALNTAAFDDVSVIVAKKNAHSERPIYLLHITSAPDEPVLTQPRTLIVAEANAGVTVLEDYVSLNDEEVYLTNAVTEIIVRENAEVHHYFLERESRGGYNISTLRAIQAKDSRLRSHTALFGGSIVRNNVLPKLDGDHCDSLLNGIYVANGRQHMDNFMRVQHTHKHGDSRQFYKGILDDQAHGVFSGRIIVSKAAQKTDAKQSNQNLLMSEDARMNTKPQLEIYADDVKCTHGATVGQLDDEAIFYLRSRGLSEEAARGLLVYAFAGESLDRMGLEPVREHLQKALIQRLPKGDMLEHVL
ncbi:MAG: Fe-S cluster assembly protein SufD [Planctomycetota bacterium]